MNHDRNFNCLVPHVVVLLLTFAAAPHSARAQNPVYSPQQMSSQTSGAAQAEYNRRELMRKYGARRAPRESGADYGRRLIASGRATVKFAPRPFPIATYLKTVWKGDAATRQRNMDEWKTQSALWQQEVRARGARTNDMADMYALAVVTSYEAYTGKRVSNAGYQRQAREFALFFAGLPAYQGYSTREKQEFYESTMLRASNALRLRRVGQSQQAQEKAEEFLNDWASGKLPGALQALAPYATSTGG